MTSTATSRSSFSLAAPRPATVVVVGSVATYAATLVVAYRFVPGHADYQLGDVIWFSAWLSYIAVGGLILRRRRGDAIGRLLLAVGALIQAAGLLTELCWLADRHGVHRPVTQALAWTASLLFIAPQALMGTALPLLYPDGAVPRDWRRWLLRLSLAAVVVATVGEALLPGKLDTYAVSNPFGLTGAPDVARVLADGGSGALAVLVIACGVSLALRWRRADAEQRPALAYLAVGVVVLVVLLMASLVGLALGWKVSQTAGGFIEAPAIAAIPVATGIAILRVNLFDIELVLRRTLTYVAVSAAVFVGYAGVIIAAGRTTRLHDSWSLSLLLTVVVAVGLTPLREWIQRQVDRLLYGRRGDPYGVLRDFDRRLAQTQDPGEVLPTVVACIGEALRLPYVAVELEAADGAPLTAVFGYPQRVARELVLRHHGRPVGRLLLAARSPGEQFTALDDQLLDDVAEHAATAAAAVMLSGQAQRSRERLVRALEDDRRRVRRDLHDHLGPVLGGVTLQLDALRRLTRDLPAASELVDTIRGEVADAVVDVRRLVHGMRPPVLDELGLIDALRHFGVTLSNGLAVTVTTADAIPDLPAAVEVAAYRIVTEALTNTVRHTDATNACVTVGYRPGQLSLDVADDGGGVTADAVAGMGIMSMRERAAELGGQFSIISDAAGTAIRCALPTGPL